MFGWIKKIAAWFKSEEKFRCGVCDFVGDTQEDLADHEKKVHPISSAALGKMREAGHSRHGHAQVGNRVYVDRPARRFADIDDEDQARAAQLSDQLIERTDPGGDALEWKGFGGGVSGGAGASGSWEAPPEVETSTAPLDPPPLPPLAPTNGDLSEVSLGADPSLALPDPPSAHEAVGLEPTPYPGPLSGDSSAGMETPADDSPTEQTEESHDERDSNDSEE